MQERSPCRARAGRVQVLGVSTHAMCRRRVLWFVGRCLEGCDYSEWDDLVEVVDHVRIPVGIRPGKWVLGWRWDCEEVRLILTMRPFWRQCLTHFSPPGFGSQTFRSNLGAEHASLGELQ